VDAGRARPGRGFWLDGLLSRAGRPGSAEDLYSHTGAGGILAKVLAGKGEQARAVELAEAAGRLLGAMA